MAARDRGRRRWHVPIPENIFPQGVSASRKIALNPNEPPNPESALGRKERQPTIAQFATGQGERLRRFLKPRVRNATDIPDIIQEVYLRLLRVPRQSTIRAPEAYIYTVTHHVLQQYTLQQARNQSPLALEEVLMEARATAESDPLLQATADQCLEGLDCALSQMSPKVQATFLFVRRDGLSMEEISKRLGISVPMAKKYLVKALVCFRRHLATMNQDAL